VWTEPNATDIAVIERPDVLRVVVAQGLVNDKVKLWFWVLCALAPLYDRVTLTFNDTFALRAVLVVIIDTTLFKIVT
jgi:hypothetical protein